MLRPICLLLLFAFLLFAGTARAEQVTLVTLDLAGDSFGNGASINETSAPKQIQPSALYRFVLSGKVHGTGLLLASQVPNGTTLAQLVTKLGGDPSFLQGSVANPGGTLPFTFINQTFNQVVGSGATSATVALKMLGKIAVDGTVTFSVTNVSVKVGGISPSDKIVFEAGSKLFIGVPSRLQFASSTISASDADPKATVTVQRAENSSGTASVKYVTADGSALAGADFTQTTGTLNFADGESSKTIDIPLLTNPAPDGDRSFTITLSEPDSASVLGTPLAATVEITDHSSAGLPRFQFDPAIYSVVEDEPSVVLTLKRSSGTAAATVSFATADGTAIDGASYQSTTGTAAFAENEAQTTVTIPLLNAAAGTSADRFFTVTISSPSSGNVLGSQRTARVVISDSEISSYYSFRGTYAGLIRSTPFSYEAAGSLRVTILPTGMFTAQVKYGGKVYNLRGKFDTTGRAVVAFSRTSSFELSLRVSGRTPGLATGAILNLGNPIPEVAQWTAKRIFYSATVPYSRPGRYTVLLEPPTPGLLDTPATLPFGPGYGAFVVAKTGTAKFVGKLGDGTPVVISGALAQDGTLPVHLLPYKTGLLFGEARFRPTLAPTDLEGTLRWRKLNDRPKDRLYPNGFEITAATLAGSLFVKPALNVRVLDLPAGTIEVSGGNIASTDTITKSFTINTSNFVNISPAGADKLRLVLNPATGIISGGFLPPPNGKLARPFVGVLLQKQKRAAGLFLGAPLKGVPVESGKVEVRL